MTADFEREQDRVLRGMVAAVTVSLVILAAGFAWWPLAPPVAPDLAARIAFALRCDLFVFAWLLAVIARIASQRFTSPADIAGSGLSQASGPIRNNRAVLQNTLEQAVLASVAHLVLATLVGERELVLIPLGVLLFGLGRACFWRGYARGAATRAFGFGLTFYPTVAAYAFAAVLIVSRA